MSDYMNNANRAFEEKKFQIALDLYNQEISVEPQNLLAYERAARCLWLLNRPVDAIALCEKLLKLDPSYAIGHVIMAEAYYDMKEFSKSEDEIRSAYTMNPNNSEVLSSYGSLLLFEKKVDDAIPYLEKAIEIDPNAYVAYHNLGAIYVRKRNRKKVLLYMKEMYRLRRTAKNAIRLTFAYMDYTRITNVLLIALSSVAVISEIFRLWPFFILALVLLIVFYGLITYQKK